MKTQNPYQYIEDKGKAYIDVRPEYPEALIDLLGICKESKIVDIGAGTGKLTAQLWKRTKKITAIEPSNKMSQGIFQAIPEFPVNQFIEATAENTTLKNAEFDLVTYGQCWHWLDAPAASREAVRILRPHGKIAILYNQLDVSIPWVLQLTRIMRSGDVQRINKPPQLTKEFTKAELFLESWEDQLSVEEIFLLGTTRASWIKTTPENRAKMRENLRWYLCEELGYQLSEKIFLPYQSQLWIAQKK